MEEAAHSKQRRIGVYPGTFDPITKGHLQLIRRASALVDHLIVAVADNPRKGPLFTVAERLAMARFDVANLPGKECEIAVTAVDTLLMKFARDAGASIIFRGLRAVSDFEYEFQMTGMNAKIAPGIETVFMMASDKWQFVSSSLIKEIFALGGDVSEYVTPNVIERLERKFPNRRSENP